MTPPGRLIVLTMGLVLAPTGCASLVHRMNQPSPEQTAQADSDATASCINSARQFKGAFCDHPPSPVPQAWIDNATSTRNSLAQTCRKNPEQMHELDLCLAALEGK